MDAIVIGGGIVGLAVARELTLRHDGIEVAVFEAEERLATHQTGNSSGVIHAGVYYEPGSLKARLCVEGAAELYAYCDERGIEAVRAGKLIVATREEELPRLEELERRGRANGVPGLRRLGPEEIAEVEPHARGLAALHSPATGRVDFAAVAEAFAADVRAGGGEIVTGVGVRWIEPGAVIHRAGRTAARLVVNCAGFQAGRLARAAGAPADPRIVPFRGSYLRLSAEKAGLVRGNVYPVPDPRLPFLGAHLTRTPGGEVLLGPTALMTGGYAWPGTWRLAMRQRRAALRELRHAVSRRALAREASRLVPEVRAHYLERGPSGTRAQAMNRDGSLVDDFVIHETKGAVHVRNAPSPAATSALALARLIVDRSADLG
jgi:2-hydroxyglutarate dehydrogenase